MRRHHIFALVWAGMLAAMPGCASKSAPSAVETVVAATPAVAEAPQSETPAAVSAEAAPPFQPPYPNRVELFIPPDLTHVVRSPSRVDGPDVAVRGFMNLDGQHVVLEINGSVHVLKVGEQQGGVEVVSINPPRVVLQRRGERWTAQLLRGRGA